MQSGKITAHSSWGGCEDAEPDMECAALLSSLNSGFILDVSRYTNTYYRTGYCHQLLDWSAEERATVAGANLEPLFLFYSGILLKDASTEVIEICGSMPVLARLLGGWMKERRPAELRRQIVAKV